MHLDLGFVLFVLGSASALGIKQDKISYFMITQ